MNDEDLFYRTDTKWSVSLIANGEYTVCTKLLAEDIEKVIDYIKSLESEEQKNGKES